MKYQSVPVTPFEQNCSVIWCEKTKECAFVDPGGDIDKLTAVVEKEGLKPVAIWLTHGHLDHVGGTVPLAERYELPIIGPQKEDAFWLDALPEQSKMFGFPPHDAFRPTRWLEHGDTRRGRTASYLSRPHTDPSERNYRTRLLSYTNARVEH